MFDGMCHPRHLILVAEAPNIDIHGGAGLVRLGVMNYQGLELIREADHPVGPVV